MQSPLCKTGSHGNVAGVAAGIVMAAAALLGTGIGVGKWRGWPAPLSAADRHVLVVASELMPRLDLVLRSDAEAYSKTRYLDGRTELAYDYLHPDPERPLRLASRVAVMSSRTEARRRYRQLAATFDAASRPDGLIFEERQAPTWGDAARYGALYEGKTVLGYVLAFRRGEKVLLLEVSGVPLEESEFGELAVSSLQVLEDYSL